VGSLDFEKKELHCTSKTTKPSSVCEDVDDLIENISLKMMF